MNNQPPTLKQIADNLYLLNELDPDDLFSLQALLHDNPDSTLDDLWFLVKARTGSLDH